jgi:hypothetical protein
MDPNEARVLYLDERPTKPDNASEVGSQPDKVNVKGLRHHLLVRGSIPVLVCSALPVVKTAINLPPYNFVFGLDVLLGCFYTRYHRAWQLRVLWGRL